MKPEIQAYQHALFIWERFQSESRYVPDEASLLSGVPSANLVDGFLRLMPPAERKSAAFGLFIRFARNWSPLRQSSFLGEFLPGPSPMERRLLEAGAEGALKPPCKLPITLEEFPSRIWKRAQAYGSPGRLVSAACLSFNAMINLREQHEDDTDLEDLMTFRIPSGDLPLVIDLAALPPVESHELKQRVIDRLMKELRAGRFEISTEDMPAIKAWVRSDVEEGKAFIEKLAAEARRTIENYLASGSLRDYHHTRRLGRLMFRCGWRTAWSGYQAFQEKQLPVVDHLHGLPGKRDGSQTSISSKIHQKFIMPARGRAIVTHRVIPLPSCKNHHPKPPSGPSACRTSSSSSPNTNG